MPAPRQPVEARLKILLLEDNERGALETVTAIRRQGLEVEWEQVQSAEEFEQRLDPSFSAVIANWHIPGTVVRAVLATTLCRAPDIPFIVVSADMSAEDGVEIMRLGASDYLSKDKLERLAGSLRAGDEQARERRDAREVETRYRTLFQQLPVGISRSEVSGETLEINPPLLRIMGYPDEATFRRETSLMKSEFMSDEARADLAAVLERDGRINDFELQLRRRDGSMAWVRMDISVVTGDAGEWVSIDAVVTDIEDRKRAEAAREVALHELRWSNLQRQRLLKQVINAQEMERKRIAQGIHDDAVQVMSAANIHLAMLGHKLDEQLGAEVDRLIDTVSLSTARLRNLLFDLQPPELERSGLVAALRMRLEILGKDMAVECELSADLDPEPSHERSLVVYRIVQEALANILKHSGATRVEMVVRTKEEGVMVRIGDNGRGFAASDLRAKSEHGHMGLASMTERAALVGGWCSLTSAPGAGTIVRLWVPVGDEVDAQPTNALRADMSPAALAAL